MPQHGKKNAKQIKPASAFVMQAYSVTNINGQVTQKQMVAAQASNGSVRGKYVEKVPSKPKRTVQLNKANVGKYIKNLQ